MTPKKRAEFLAVLRETANVSRACETVNISRQTAYKWREEEKEFARNWDETLEAAADDLEQEARRRAYQGVDKPVFYQGIECGAVREYSDTLLIFLLKAHKPDRFRDRVEHTGKDGNAIQVETRVILPSDEGEPSSTEAENV